MLNFQLVYVCFYPIPKYLHVRIGVFCFWSYWNPASNGIIGMLHRRYLSVVRYSEWTPSALFFYFPALSSRGQSESLRLGARCRRQLSTTTGTIGSLWRNLLLFHLLGCKSAIEVFWSYGTIILTTNDNNFTYLYKKKRRKWNIDK